MRKGILRVFSVGALVVGSQPRAGGSPFGTKEAVPSGKKRRSRLEYIGPSSVGAIMHDGDFRPAGVSFVLTVIINLARVFYARPRARPRIPANFHPLYLSGARGHAYLLERASIKPRFL